MILIGEVKYACTECIRGHRSSSCRHHSRPLLQVRSKGRPTIHANGNPNHRVAVFAEEIDESTSESGPESDGNTRRSSPVPTARGSCQKTPVVILKASAKQVLDLTSGQILGPYDESKTNKKPSECNARKPPPVISDASFINSSSCCSNGVSKIKKSCCCNNNKSKTVNKSKILKTYINKHFADKPFAVSSNNSSLKWETSDQKSIQNIIPNTHSTKIQHSNNITPPNFESQYNTTTPPTPPLQPLPQHQYDQPTKNQVYDVVSIPSCSIPGSCCCGDECSCEGCFVHGNATSSDLSKILPPDFNLDYLNNNVNFNNSLPELTTSNTDRKDVVFNVISEKQRQIQSQPAVVLKSQREPSNPLESYSNFLMAQNSLLPAPSDTPQSTSLSSDTSSPASNNITTSCTCPPDECECHDCETHGNLDGIKLDELFSGSTGANLDVKNWPLSWINEVDIGGLLDSAMSNNHHNVNVNTNHSIGHGVSSNLERNFNQNESGNQANVDSTLAMMAAMMTTTTQNQDQIPSHNRQASSCCDSKSSTPALAEPPTKSSCCSSKANTNEGVSAKPLIAEGSSCCRKS